MALHLKLRSRHSHILTIRLLSSSSSPFPPPPPPSTSSDEPSPESQSQSQQSSFSSFFRSSPSPPRRIPFNPPPPATLSDTTSSSFDDIRKKLSSYRQSAPSSATSSSPNISFQELLRNNPSGSDSKVLPFNSIRESLRQRPSQGQNDPLNLSSLQETLRSHLAEGNSGQSSLFGSGGSLPDSIFGREAKGLKKEDGDDNSLKTEFLKSYTEAELGEKLRKLRPEESEKKGFSLTEMNERLAKLRKLEKDSTIYGLSSSDFRESLVSLTQDNDKKKNFQRLSILANIGGLTTPSFMLKPPQDELLEKFFHPDHMSSAEKMKIELKRVRDEFKMSDSDCGSARVQVAQLTTKIKHLSGALHKKDKHSKKGLQEMVQRRKKLLKYLRRTDWDSYCLVLSKLGLRDVPEFKVPDYKKTQSKSKSKSKKKKKMKA